LPKSTLIETDSYSVGSLMTDRLGVTAEFLAEWIIIPPASTGCVVYCQTGAWIGIGELVSIMAVLGFSFAILDWPLVALSITFFLFSWTMLTVLL